jgi:tetratricopeptide (TPR) repeat protein
MRTTILIALFPTFAAPLFSASVLVDSHAFDDLIAQGRAAFLASDLDRAESDYNQACPAGVTESYPVAKAVTCEDSLASVDEARGDLPRAERQFLRAVSLAEQAGPAYLPLYCARLIDLGEHYHRAGRAADSEATFQKAVDIARSLTATQSALLPGALVHLGRLYSDSAQPERGRAPLTEALALMAAPGVGGRAKPPATEIALAHDLLGLIDLASGRLHEAESNLRESVALATGALGEDHPVSAAYQTNLALVLMEESEPGPAELLLRRAQFVVESLQSPPGSELAAIYAGLSDVASAQGRYEQAGDYARRAISILNMQQRPDAHSLAVAQMTLAGVYLRAHDSASAEKILPAAVEIQRQVTSSPGALAIAIQLLAELRAQQRNWEAAEALYREAIGIYERRGPENANPRVAPLLRALADVLKHEGGSKEEVRALESRARDMLRSATQSAPRS